MTFRIFLPCVAMLCILHAFAAPVPGGENAGTRAAHTREQALQHKTLGDQYASQGDYQKASDEFLLALSLDRSAFSEDAQVRMAVILSWAERAGDAIAVLQPIVRQNPKNHDARVHLARVLSWTGRHFEAEGEADAVLAGFPDSTEALLVKANILRWRGDSRGAAFFYRKILDKKEDFDARLGLVYAQLEAGDRKKAEEDAGLLKPGNANQVKERDRLQEALHETSRSSSSVFLSHYKDSDGNRVDAYGLSYGFPIGKAQSDFAYRQVHAGGGPGSTSAEEASLKTYHKQGRNGAGGGIGLVHAGRAQAPYIVTGHVRADTGAQGWLVGAAAAKNTITDTAQLIRNRIVQKSGEVFASRDFPSGYALTGSFRNSQYSDDNRSQDWLIRLSYTVSPPNPSILIGYKLRALDFNRQSGGGYFEPQRFYSNVVQAEVRAEAGRFHASFEPTFGCQEFSRFGARNYQVVYSARAAAGYALRKNILVDISGESGKNGAGTVSVYKYSVADVRLTGMF